MCWQPAMVAHLGNTPKPVNVLHCPAHTHALIATQEQVSLRKRQQQQQQLQGARQAAATPSPTGTAGSPAALGPGATRPHLHTPHQPGTPPAPTLTLRDSQPAQAAMAPAVPGPDFPQPDIKTAPLDLLQLMDDPAGEQQQHAELPAAWQQGVPHPDPTAAPPPVAVQQGTTTARGPVEAASHTD